MYIHKLYQLVESLQIFPDTYVYHEDEFSSNVHLEEETRPLV